MLIIHHDNFMYLFRYTVYLLKTLQIFDNLLEINFNNISKISGGGNVTYHSEEYSTIKSPNSRKVIWKLTYFCIFRYT